MVSAVDKRLSAELVQMYTDSYTPSAAGIPSSAGAAATPGEQGDNAESRGPFMDVTF